MKGGWNLNGFGILDSSLVPCRISSCLRALVVNKFPLHPLIHPPRIENTVGVEAVLYALAQGGEGGGLGVENGGACADGRFRPYERCVAAALVR